MKFSAVFLCLALLSTFLYFLVGTTTSRADPGVFNGLQEPIIAANTRQLNRSTNPGLQETKSASTTELATFGNGCFWCTEAIFEGLDGVISATSGYSGGATDNPAYKDVCSGTTSHAEVIQIQFDPSKTSYATLLKAFWMSHDPTTLFLVHEQKCSASVATRIWVTYLKTDRSQQD